MGFIDVMKLHEPALTLLRVAEGAASTRTTCTIDVDEYVPLQCRTPPDRPGGGYVRPGNYSTTLLERAVEPTTQVLHGVTITCMEDIAPWPNLVLSETLDGIPVLSTRFHGYEAVDLQDDVKVAARSGEIVVSGGELVRCTGYRCDRACFVAANGVLTGVWFTGLTDHQTKVFMSHVGAT